MKPVSALFGILLLLGLFSCHDRRITEHVFEIHEIVLHAEDHYVNPYRDVECWVRLKGPGFDKRIHGFWDGGQTFRVRMAAIAPGEWTWESGSNVPEDDGLNGKSGKFRAIEWSAAACKKNPNRRGYIRPSPNGHALQYADGTPFFFLGDTWWSASTWRYPLTGVEPDNDWDPGPLGHSFENMLNYRKKQGYNSLAMIACFPNWDDDGLPPRVVDKQGNGIRQAWEKFGKGTAKDMHDENGNLPFELTENPPLANFDRINPRYFQSLDKKMDYLDSIGFVPMLETVRRDHGPSWKACFDWPGSFNRYIRYIVARYGAYNMIFSPIHLDWIIPAFSLTGEEFNEALREWYREDGPLPYGQPVTSLINPATHIIYGTGDEVPWLTMHSVGNNPRDNGFFPMLEDQFRISPAKPTANLEPYYPGWKTLVGKETIERNSGRDNYFARSQAWGSVLSGGLAGYMYGTGAYDGTTVGEEVGERPVIWDALKYPSGEQVAYLRLFLESEEGAYQELRPSPGDLHPRKSEYALPVGGFDGWSFLMVTPERKLAMLYFENKSKIPEVSNLLPASKYELRWFDPVTGEWQEKSTVKTTSSGTLVLKNFPEGEKISSGDWAMKIRLAGI